MTDVLLRVGASKLAVSVVLASIAWASHRRWRFPALAHAQWLLVLGVLLVPALFAIPVVDLAEFSGLGRWAGGGGAVVPGRFEALVAGTSGIPAESVKRILVVVWLAGSVLVLLGTLWRVVALGRTLRRASAPAGSGLQRMVEEVSREIGLARLPVVVTTAARLSPLVWWAGGRVRVVLSEPVLSVVDARQLRWIVAHELAHVKRRDHWVRWLEWLACVAFWWNPVAWWARSRLREAEEQCCDAAVLQCPGADPRAYAGLLLTVVEVLSGGTRRAVSALASGVDGGDRSRLIERRLKMIIGRTAVSGTPRRLRVLPGLCLAAALPLGLAYCGPDAVAAPEAAAESGVAGLVATAVSARSLADGSPVVIVARDGSVNGRGYAVTVRRHDGTAMPAIFRGPRKLLDRVSGSRLEFQEDSLPPRVRLVRSGEEMRRETPPASETAPAR